MIVCSIKLWIFKLQLNTLLRTRMRFQSSPRKLPQMLIPLLLWPISMLDITSQMRFWMIFLNKFKRPWSRQDTFKNTLWRLLVAMVQWQMSSSSVFSKQIQCNSLMWPHAISKLNQSLWMWRTTSSLTLLQAFLLCSSSLLQWSSGSCCWWMCRHQSISLKRTSTSERSKSERTF